MWDVLLLFTISALSLGMISLLKGVERLISKAGDHS